MSNTRNLADLLDTSGDIKSAALDNVDVSGKLSLSGGAMTGAITTNSTFDGTSTGIDDNADATAMTIDSAENVGLGTTPKTTSSTYTNLQVGGTGTVLGYKTQVSGSDFILGNNVYYNSGFKRMYNEQASIVEQLSGKINFKVSGAAAADSYNEQASIVEQLSGKINFKVSGAAAADSAITWTNAMAIKNNGQIQMAGYDGGTGACLGINAQDSLAAAIYLRLISAADSNQTMIQFSDSAEQDCGTITTNASANSTAYNTSSDYRLKENVAPMTNQIARLKNLKPSTWDWKKEENYTGGEGFLAHELNTVVPLAVTGEKDAMRPEVLYVEGDEIPEGKSVGDVKRAEIPKYQGVDYSKLVPLLTGALQEAVDKIEALEARIAALEI